MATSYTTLLGFALPVTGELQGTWGDTVNNSITQLCEDSIAGVATASVLSADWTLTTTGSGAANQSRMAILIPTGSPGVSRDIIAPSKSKTYTVINQSNAAVVIKGAATTGVTIAAGDTVVVAWNGSDFVAVKYASNSYTNLTVSGSLTLSGGTANGVAYLNGSKVLTSGSALYFDGTNLGIGTTSGGEKLTVNGNIASPADAYLYSYTGSSAGTISSGIRLLGSASTAVFYTASLERMRIDASGNLGLGVTPKTSTGSYVAFEFGQSGYLAAVTSGAGIQLASNTYVAAGAVNRYSTTGAATYYGQSGGIHSWHNAPSGTAGNAISFTQAMTLDASGALLVGTTSNLYSTERVSVLGGTSGDPVAAWKAQRTNGQHIFINSAGGLSGYIDWTGTTTTYVTSSDQRLKENIIDAPSAIDSIKAIKVRSFNWKSDGTHVDYGYIAQELLEVAPEAVHVSKDGEQMMGIDFGKLTPRIIKTIQEQQTLIETLTARIATLEAK